MLDASTSFVYGFFDKAVTKASGNLDMATVVDPGFQLFLPVNVKAQIKIKSDQPSDSAVTWDGWAYDVNFATAAAEARLTATPTIPTAAYEVNDTVGAQMSFVVGASRGTVVGARLLDKAKQSKPFEIWLFRASISTPSDASAFNPSATDLEKLVGVLRVNDWFDANANSIGQAENLPLAFAGLSGTTLYGWLVTRGTPDYVNSTDLIVELDVLKE